MFNAGCMAPRQPEASHAVPPMNSKFIRLTLERSQKSPHVSHAESGLLHQAQMGSCLRMRILVILGIGSGSGAPLTTGYFLTPPHSGCVGAILPLCVEPLWVLDCSEMTWFLLRRKDEIRGCQVSRIPWLCGRST